jgi:AcrR family transcriptional regulator
VTDRVVSRPGGRSARVQAAVHEAVEGLLAEGSREDLSLPLIAARAGVTPSTLYRRWGDLTDLLADVAFKRMRTDQPADTGSLAEDLTRWLEQYAEEMTSEPGRAMLRDLLAAGFAAGISNRCCAINTEQLRVICQRAEARGETAPDVDMLIEQLVAPILYRILFDDTPVDRAYCAKLLARVL